MFKSVLALGMTALLIAGCSKSPSGQSASLSMASFDVQEPATAPPSPNAAPQIAYHYGLSYNIGASDIKTVQQRQSSLCARLGIARCRVASSSLNSSGAGQGIVSGDAKFLIDARIAQPFIRRLDMIVGSVGGEAASRQTNAEDVTKQMIDTDARVRAKQALADRLLRLIQNANGKVSDLVAAEKAFADVQEELDAARSTQAALRQRVAMSEIAIEYGATEATGIASPIRDSFRSASLTFGTSIGTMVTFVVGSLPWLALLAVVTWAFRHAGWQPWQRLRRKRRNADEEV